MMEKNQGIYLIKLNDRCLYVGQSCDLKRRHGMHIWMLKNNRHSNAHLQSIANKYGVDSLSFHVIEYVDCHDDLTSREQFYIDNINPECNMQLASESGMWSPSQEVRDKISNGQKGKKKSFSEQGIEAIRKVHSGKHLSEETRQKISEAKSGVMLSDDCAQVKHPCPSREWLEGKLAEFQGGSNLAMHIGVSKTTVRRWCNILGVPFYASDWGKVFYERPSLNKLVSALIYNGYVNASKVFGVSKNVVKRWCREYDIPYKKSDWMEVVVK